MRHVIAMVMVVVPLMYGCANQKRANVAGEKIVKIHATAFFNFDSHAIRKDMRPVLDGVAEKMETDPDIVVVMEGHTDKTGSVSYNEVLAEKRARAVGAYLAQEGVNHRRMTFVSKGEKEPADPRSNRDARRKNRRVEIHQM